MSAAWLTRIHVVRPLKAGPTGGLAATERDRAADGRSGPDDIELLATSFGACPVHLDAAARAARPQPAQSSRPSWIRTIAATTVVRNARPEPSSARQHQASTEGPASSGRAPRNSSSNPERTRRDLRRLQRLQREHRYR